MSDLPLPPPSGSSASSSPPPPPPPILPAGIPAGYHAYDTNPYGQYAKAIKGVATATQILVAAVTAITIVTTVVALSVRDTFIDFLDGTASRSDAENAIAAIGIASLLAGLLQLAGAVVTIIWMYRVASNHRLLGRVGSTWAPGWAIGGWFCPPVLFVIPWLMLRELWRGSAPGTPPNDPDWKSAPVSPIVTLWWLLFGLGGIVIAGLQVASAGIGGSLSDSAEFYRDTVGWTVVSSAVTVASGISFILLVRGITQRQASLLGSR